MSSRPFSCLLSRIQYRDGLYSQTRLRYDFAHWRAVHLTRSAARHLQLTSIPTLLRPLVMLNIASLYTD